MKRATTLLVLALLGGSAISLIPFQAVSAFPTPAPPSLALTANTGIVGGSVGIEGSGYSSSTTTTYGVCFSYYVNSYCNGFSPSFISTNSDGDIVPESLTIPQTASGGYFVDIVSSSCCQIYAQQALTVEPFGLNISPTSGAQGQVISVSATDLTPGDIYDVCFTTSPSGCNQGVTAIAASAAGTLSASLTVPDSDTPSNNGGNGNYWVDLTPSGGVAIASSPFTITPTTITLSSDAGDVGTAITVGGAGYAPSTTTSYSICFSYYVNSYCNGFSPSFISTDSSGNIIPASFSIPGTGSGGYYVDIVTPSCCTIFAQAGFSVESNGLATSPTAGPEGTSISVSASDLAPGGVYVVCFSTSTSSCSGGSTSAVADGSGAITTSVTVPDLTTESNNGGNGNYWVDLSPFDGGVIAADPFIVTPTLVDVSPGQAPSGTTITISGTGYAASTSGVYAVCFSQYYNSWCNNFSPSSIATDSSGSFTTTLTAPPSGANYVDVVSPACGPCTILAQAEFGDGSGAPAPQTITLSSNSGAVGTMITLSGSGYTPSTTSTYSLCFSYYINSYCDGFSSSFVPTDSSGNIDSQSLTVPQTASGGYYVEIVSPSCCTILAQEGFSVLSFGLSISPTSGPEGQSISVSAGDLTPSSLYVVCLSTSTGSCSGGSTPVIASGTGAISASLSVPNLATPSNAGSNGNYWIDLSPFGGGVIAADSFIVTPTTLSLSASTGTVGTAVTINGGGYAATTGTVYSVCFSYYINSYCDGFSPSFISTDSSGNIVPQSLTIPQTPAGGYYVQIVSPACCTILAQQGISVDSFGLTTSPALGPEGQTFSVSASELTPGAVYDVCFTTSTSSCSGGSTALIASGSGGISTTLTVPALTTESNAGGNGNYWVDLYPSGGGVIAASPFIVTPQTLTIQPDFGHGGVKVKVTGTGYAESTTTTYLVCVSQYINSYCNGGTAAAIKTGSTGDLVPVKIKVPASSQPIVYVQIVAPTCCEIIQQASFQFITSATTLACTPASVAVDSATSCTATVNDISTSPTTPTGTVSFSSTGAGTFAPATCTLSTVSTSTGTCSVTFTPALGSEGSHVLTAIYGGDSKHTLSVSKGFKLTVTERTTTVTVSPNTAKVKAGKSLKLEAEVTDSNAGTTTNPTGTVTWSDGGAGGSFSSATCSLVSKTGSTSVSLCSVKYTTSATPKTAAITATYGGDSNHDGSSGTSSITGTS